MASVVKGYEYDIFISYRQNDNKYDRRVNEFVINLGNDLEANSYAWKKKFWHLIK